MIHKEILEKYYLGNGRSMQEIAQTLRCSLHKVSYWMEKHQIRKRSISDAIYLKRNPEGDPFTFQEPKTKEEAMLFGMGIGLYWGEGTKANKNSVRLGNTDPQLISKFIDFLTRFFQIERSDLKFGLQLFTDMNPALAMDFWLKHLKIRKEQINRPVITRSVVKGTYRKKSQYGVLTVMYHNKKLRDLLVRLLPM